MKRTLQPAPVITEPVASVEPARPKRSLKRTASAASLPTPPRTTHKKRRKKDDKDVDGEEEEEAEEFESSEDEKPIKPAQRAVGKGRASPSKAKVRSKVTEEEVEDAFWLGTSPKADYVELKSTTPKKTPATIVSTPVSPPPSRSNQRGPQFKTPSPKHKRVASVASSSGGRLVPIPEEDDSDGPIRDSPNNLFLSNAKIAHTSLPLADDEADFEPQPTVTYVFRGKRVEFPNPHYNLPPEVHARAKLPLEHPDFSPSPDVKPKRLFADEIAEEGKKPKRKRSINLPSPSPSPTRPKRKVTTIKKQRTLVTTSS